MTLSSLASETKAAFDDVSRSAERLGYATCMTDVMTILAEMAKDAKHSDSIVELVAKIDEMKKLKGSSDA